MDAFSLFTRIQLPTAFSTLRASACRRARFRTEQKYGDFSSEKHLGVVVDGVAQSAVKGGFDVRNLTFDGLDFVQPAARVMQRA
jgi:hypothetical protein